MHETPRDLAASAEMIIAAAAFTLGAIAFMSIEGWMGTTLFLLGATAALGALWTARWEEERPEHRQAGWEDVADQNSQRQLAFGSEIVLGATCFLLGGAGYIAIAGWLGSTMLALGTAAALGGFWVAHREARPQVD